MNRTTVTLWQIVMVWLFRILLAAIRCEERTVMLSGYVGSVFRVLSDGLKDRFFRRTDPVGGWKKRYLPATSVKGEKA